jgi:hypothetical protein
VRALVELHALHMLEFWTTWKRAKAAGVELPSTEDPDYNSMEHVLRHTLGAAVGELRWICEQLELPDPCFDPMPGIEMVESATPDYLKHVLQRWRVSLVGVQENQLGPQAYSASWGADYCIDAMLEHAVMHPIRHSHQLKRLMG